MGEKQIVRVYTDQSSLLRLHMPNEVGSALNTHKARGPGTCSPPSRAQGADIISGSICCMAVSPLRRENKNSSSRRESIATTRTFPSTLTERERATKRDGVGDTAYSRDGSKGYCDRYADSCTMYKLTR